MLKVPFHPDTVMLSTFLGACRKWGNVKLGTLAFGQALLVDHSCASAYVLMTDIFAAAGMKDDAKKVEIMWLKYAGLEDKANSLQVAS